MMRRDLIGETLLNQFRVETFLAAGGMATIYRVWDLQRSVPLAMKVLDPELGSDPSFIARFQREAESLRMLVHPNIVPFYGLFQSEGLTFLLERYIDGPSLDEVLRVRGGQPLPLGEALVYFKALYTSLGYAHAQGIIHCDVKPGNVLIDQGGHVYLTDFGIARFVDAATTTSSAMGTPLYMAPEQIRGERVGPESDVYALGVVMFELLTGQRPFRGDAGVPEGVGPSPSDRIRYQHVHQPPPDPRSINPAIPEGVSRVILRAMAKDRSARYSGVGAMAAELSQVVAARFETLPDRVSLPGQRPLSGIAESSAGVPRYPPPPPVGVAPAGSGPHATMAGGARGAPPTSAREAARAPQRPFPLRRLLLLGGLAALLLLCLLAGGQLVSAFRAANRPQAGLPPLTGDPTTATVPGATVPPEVTASPSPTGSAATEAVATGTAEATATTSPALGDFPVQGQVAIVRAENGAPALFLLDFATGQETAMPGVPNVSQREVNAPQWSPDGQRLAWTVQYNGRPHVVAMDMDEMEPYQLPAGERYNRLSSPAFLPGGERISFWSSNGSGNALIIADAVTGELIEEISLPGYRNMVVWNWQQERVALIYGTGGTYKVGVGDSPGGEVLNIETGGEGYAPAWSNDGQQIAFQSDAGRNPGMNEIWVAGADGGGARAVTSTPAEFWSRAPSWSPDGRMIAFVSNRAGSRGADYGELFVVNLETGETRQITQTNGSVYDWRPAWRP